jgi:hypothetical protein
MSNLYFLLLLLYFFFLRKQGVGTQRFSMKGTQGNKKGARVLAAVR